MIRWRPGAEVIMSNMRGFRYGQRVKYPDNFLDRSYIISYKRFVGLNAYLQEIAVAVVF